MAENTVFLLLTAIIRNIYKFLMGRLDTKAFGLKKCSRIKAFVFKFISVPAKWIRTARHYELNIYTHFSFRAKPYGLRPLYHSSSQMLLDSRVQASPLPPPPKRMPSSLLTLLTENALWQMMLWCCNCTTSIVGDIYGFFIIKN